MARLRYRYGAAVAAGAKTDGRASNLVRIVENRMLIGDEFMTILHLGNGETLFSAETGKPHFPVGDEHRPDFPFDLLENSVFQEPAMHHGVGFDIFIIE